MLTEARMVSVSGKDIARDMYRRREITKEKYQVLMMSPKAAKKVDLYTIIPETISGWTKYAREVSVYESEAEYINDIATEYTVRDLIGGGKGALR